MEKQKFKILDIDCHDNIVILYLGKISLTEWTGESWDDPNLEMATIVNPEFVTHKVHLVVNPEKYSVVSVYDMAYDGYATFSKETLLKNEYPLFVITKHGVRPELHYWDAETRKYKMGDEIEIPVDRKIITYGY